LVPPEEKNRSILVKNVANANITYAKLASCGEATKFHPMSQMNEVKQVRTTSLGWMIQRIAKRLDLAMEARLSPLDMNLLHFAVMMTVLETEGLTQTEIGSRFSTPPYAISRALDHLEKAGHLERRAHPKSRRSHTVHASVQGKALGPTLFAIIRETNAELTAALSASEGDVLQGLLAKLA